MWCKELTHLKRPWCWERLRAGGEGDERGWDGWMASSTWWAWIWLDSECWWWTGWPGMLRFTGSQKVRHDWTTELNWNELIPFWLVEFLMRNQLITDRSSLYIIWHFPSVSFNILSFSLTLVSLITMCLGCSYLALSFLEVCASQSWLTTSFPILGKLSATVS